MLNITNTYRRYALTLKEINELAATDPEFFVMTAEQAFRDDVRSIARSIVNSKFPCRVVMLSGPSASGKTTTAKMLQEELLYMGCGSEIVSMDNFYLGEENVPRTSENKPDFETVHALNVPLVEKCISDLLEKGSCDIAQFDFALSRPKDETLHIDLKNDSVAIIEGIHALNPIFTKHIKSTLGMKKMYISVKQGIRAESGGGYLLTAAELRLFRRIVRDYNFRGSSVEHTLDMWPNVLFGEKKYIVPYKYSGDITVNSIHIYEPCVTAPRIIELMEKVTPDCPDYEYVQDLAERAKHFVPIDESLVPENSLLREFLGKGKYSY